MREVIIRIKDDLDNPVVRHPGLGQRHARATVKRLFVNESAPVVRGVPAIGFVPGR